MKVFNIRIELILLVALLGPTNSMYSQFRPKLYTKVLKENETMPEFPGGRDSLFCFIENVWNKNLVNKVDSGVIYVKFEVNKLGKVHSIEIDARNPYRSITSEGLIPTKNSKIKSEVLTVFENMPNWKPRMIGKRPKKSGIQTVVLGFPYIEQCKNN